MQNPSPVEVVPGSVSGVQAAPVERPAQMRRLTSGKLLALSLGMFALTLGVQALLMVGVRALVGDGPAFWGVATSIVGGAGYGSTVVLALWGAARSIAELARAPVWRAGPYSVLTSVAIAVSSLVMVGLGILAALLSTFGFSRGRQLRRRGRILLPPVQAGAAWVGSGFVLDSPQLAPSGLAQQWRENGRTEHASVASFARLTLDLMALGAPPALVASASHDALDEIRHTEACFGLAHWFDGEPASPGAFPEAQSARTLPRTRVFALATLAVTSLVDGALHEGVSARILAKLGKRCEQPAIRAVLKQIAADEGRHAAHGWDVVQWCLEEGGAPVAQALLGALAVLPKQMRSDLPEAAQGGAWEPWGIHGRSLEVEEYAATRAHVVSRVRALVTHENGTRNTARADASAVR